MDDRDYFEEDGITPMTCNDCGRLMYYAYEDEKYHHVSEPERGCWLIGPEVRT